MKVRKPYFYSWSILKAKTNFRNLPTVTGEIAALLPASLAVRRATLLRLFNGRHFTACEVSDLQHSWNTWKKL
jgi:hypothetical protein